MNGISEVVNLVRHDWKYLAFENALFSAGFLEKFRILVSARMLLFVRVFGI